MEPKDFLLRHEDKLLQVLRDYDSGKIEHREASEYAWSVISECQQAGVPSDAAYTIKEHAFWAAIWSLQHLADEEHWADNITQPDVRRYIRILSGAESLPPGEEALRPQAR